MFRKSCMRRKRDGGCLERVVCGNVNGEKDGKGGRFRRRK